VGVQQGLCENVRGAEGPIGLLNRRLGSLLGSQDELCKNVHGAKGPIGLLNRMLESFSIFGGFRVSALRFSV